MVQWWGSNNNSQTIPVMRSLYSCVTMIITVTFYYMANLSPISYLDLYWLAGRKNCLHLRFPNSANAQNLFAYTLVFLTCFQFGTQHSMLLPFWTCRNIECFLICHTNLGRQFVLIFFAQLAKQRYRYMNISSIHTFDCLTYAEAIWPFTW